MVSRRTLDTFVDDDVLPPEDICFWWLPNAKTEPRPRPNTDERVLLVPFIERGLSPPLHDFVRGLLHHYSVQPHHLSPNGILHIACFITLCECYLGVPPHWGLWKKIFMVKLRTAEPRGHLSIYGGVGIQVKPSTMYFDLNLPDTVRKWQDGWLYAPTFPIRVSSTGSQRTPTSPPCGIRTGPPSYPGRRRPPSIAEW